MSKQDIESKNRERGNLYAKIIKHIFEEGF